MVSNPLKKETSTHINYLLLLLRPCEISLQVSLRSVRFAIREHNIGSHEDFRPCLLGFDYLYGINPGLKLACMKVFYPNLVFPQLKIFQHVCMPCRKFHAKQCLQSRSCDNPLVSCCTLVSQSQAAKSKIPLPAPKIVK